MPTVTAVVVGAGHAGLAMSRHLTAGSIDHVVLERGEVASSWRTQRWDSLRLLTPNWMARLPGWDYQGTDPNGYLSAREVVDLVTAYAAATSAPVLTGTTVTAVRPGGEGFEVDTDQGRWHTRTVVLAAGMTRSVIPAVARRMPTVFSLSALDYRNPDQLPLGGALVVGASASGVQIADELQRSGRQVTLAVGEHVRVPRTYRGRDILWWLEALGILDERWDEVDDVVRARHLPSLQLVGASRSLDLNSLQESGVRLVGRFGGIRDDIAQFSGSLANVCALADLKLGRLLDLVDDHVGGRGERLEPTLVRKPTLGIGLRSGEIRSVVWATGFRPDFSWLDVPVFDHRGRLLHEGGVTRWPGLYVLGLPMLRRRRSSYLDGARCDAADLSAHLTDALKEAS
jgi:putative flavoprotein involved in K+ transport